MEALAANDPRYADATMSRLLSAARQPSNGAMSQAFGAVAPLESSGDGGLVLLTGRDLYTDRTSAALRMDDADRLGRSAFVDLHPADSAARGIEDGAAVVVRGNGAALPITARVSEDVAEGSVFASLLWDGGAVQALLPADGSIGRVEVERG